MEWNVDTGVVLVREENNAMSFFLIIFKLKNSYYYLYIVLVKKDKDTVWSDNSINGVSYPGMKKPGRSGFLIWIENFSIFFFF